MLAYAAHLNGWTNDMHMTKAAPSREQDRVMIRLPDGLRPLLRRRAQGSYRTMNAEIVMLIERGLAAENVASAPSA